jgi:sterol 24-C-methyltransferase
VFVFAFFCSLSLFLSSIYLQMTTLTSIESSVRNTTQNVTVTHGWILLGVCIVIMVIWASWHRLRTSERLRALRNLTQLSDRDVEAYHNSYKQIFEDNTMVSSLRDYEHNVPPAPFRIQHGDVSAQSRSTVDCYQVLNLLCALGNVKKMYIPKSVDPKQSLVTNQELQEKSVAQMLFPESTSHSADHHSEPRPPPSDRSVQKLLELGCGCGRIAHHMAQITGCHVTGVNIDRSQIADASEYARDTNMSDRLTFVLGDFNAPLPFEDSTFDGIYDLGGFTTFIRTYDHVFAELHRVLRPGGRVVLSDGVLLDKFDTQNERHMHLLAKSRPVMAGGAFLHYKYFEDIARRAGFHVEQSGSGDVRTRGSTAPDLPTLEREHAHFGLLQWAVKWGVRMCLLPKYMNGLLERVRDGGEELVTMEREGLLTMVWDFVFVKEG